MSSNQQPLQLNISDTQLKGIQTPEIIDIMRTIKQIQKRMKDPDVSGLEYIRVYDKLGREFDSFFNRYTGIFVKVIRGENLNTLASVLYYKDQMARGFITEGQLRDQLASKYLPAHLKAESDIKLKEMQEKGEI